MMNIHKPHVGSSFFPYFRCSPVVSQGIICLIAAPLLNGVRNGRLGALLNGLLPKGSPNEIHCSTHSDNMRFYPYVSSVIDFWVIDAFYDLLWAHESKGWEPITHLVWWLFIFFDCIRYCLRHQDILHRRNKKNKGNFNPFLYVRFWNLNARCFGAF